MRRSEPLRGGGWLEASYWVGQALTSDLRERTIVSYPNGRTLLAPVCDSDPEGESATLGEAPNDGSIPIEEGEEYTSVVQLADLSWTVRVSTRSIGT